MSRRRGIARKRRKSSFYIYSVCADGNTQYFVPLIRGEIRASSKPESDRPPRIAPHGTFLSFVDLRRSGEAKIGRLKFSFNIYCVYSDKNTLYFVSDGPYGGSRTSQKRRVYAETAGNDVMPRLRIKNRDPEPGAKKTASRNEYMNKLLTETAKNSSQFNTSL